MIKSLPLLFLLFVLLFRPLLAQQPQEPETENYKQGVTLFERGLYEHAAEELNHFIEQNPSHQLIASARFYRVRALARVNPDHQAAYYQRFIQTRPNSVFAQKLLFDLAHTARQNNNYEEALRYYEQVTTHNVTDKQKARAYYWMAETAVEMDDLASARRYFQRLYDEFPESEWAPQALYSKGRLFLSTQQFDEASQTFELLKQQYPNDEITRRVGTALGEAYYKQGRYQEALEALQESLAYLEGEQKTKAVLLIAESYSALGQLDEASTTYRRYINITEGTPAERAAHYGLGWVYFKREIYHWAADEFAKAAEGNDLTARKALYYKAVMEKLGGQYRESLRTFRTFSDRYQSGQWFEKGYYEYAVTAYEMGRYGEAIQALLFVIRSDEEMQWAGKIYTLLGQAYFANNEYSRALTAYKAAEELTDIPAEVKRQAHFQKAWLFYRSGGYDNAQPIFASLHDEAPESEIGRKALFWSADSYFYLNRFGPAASRFQRFIQQNPNHELTGAAYYSLGWSYFKMGEYRQAIEPFQTFLNDYEPPEIALYPYDIDTRLRLADSYYALSNYDQAIQTYQTLVGDERGGDYALFQIANSYYRAEQNYRAVTTFRKLLSMYPNSSLREQAQYNIAYIYLNSGNYEQAIAELQTVISNYPGTSWAALAQYNIGDAYYNSGRYEQAVEAYQKVLQNYPESEYVVEAANGIDYARMAASMGAGAANTDTTSALETFIQNNPDAANNAGLQYQQAQQFMRTGDYINAAQKLEKVVETTDDEEVLVSAYLDLAEAYYQTDQTANAVETYQTVVRQFEGSEEAAAALVELGNIQYVQGNYQSAIDYYNRVVTNGGSYQLEAQTNWGDALLALNSASEAQQHYQAALNIDGNYAPAKIGLARVAFQQSNFAGVTELLAPVASANTGAPGAEAQYLIGKAQLEAGNFEQALDAFSKVQVLYEYYDNWVARSIMGSAKAHIQLGNQTQARQLLQELINQYPGTQQAQRAQQMLE